MWVLILYVIIYQKFLNLTDSNAQVVTTRSGLHQLRKRLHTFANTPNMIYKVHFFRHWIHVYFAQKKSTSKVCNYIVVRNYHSLRHFTPLQHPFDYFLKNDFVCYFPWDMKRSNNSYKSVCTTVYRTKNSVNQGVGVLRFYIFLSHSFL